MNRLAQFGVECCPLSMVGTVDNVSEAILIHCDNSVCINDLIAHIDNMEPSSSIKLVMINGKDSEIIHDCIDDWSARHRLEIATIWSDDSIDESLWEFINVHVMVNDVNMAKIIVLSESLGIRVCLLKEITQALEAIST